MPNLRQATRWAALLIGTAAMAIETPQFTLVQKLGELEVRDYPALVVAEAKVTGERSEAAGAAFGLLAGYIFGNNRAQAKFEMTAPVLQEPQIVNATASPDGWVVQFVLPRSAALQALPSPNDARVTLRQLPPRRFAVVRYSGNWSEQNFTVHLQALRAAMQREKLTGLGEPVWARYDAPYKPSFLRTNEILIELARPEPDAGR